MVASKAQLCAVLLFALTVPSCGTKEQKPQNPVPVNTQEPAPAPNPVPTPTPVPAPGTPPVPPPPAPPPAPPASPGCGTNNQDTGLMNTSIKVGSTKRTFIRVVSPSYDSTHKHALIIGFHGAGLDGTSPRRDHRWDLVENMAGDEAIFLYPNGLGGVWDASRDAALFDELVKTQSTAYCIDQSRIFVHGFSNGSFFVNSLVSMRTSAIRAVITVAGNGPGARLPAMIIHGTNDQNIGYYPNAKNVVDNYTRLNSCTIPNKFNSVAMGTCQFMDGCPSNLPVLFCPWNGPHHWPEFSLTYVWQFIQLFQ